MSIAFAPLFSGSSGNATLVSCNNTNILIDSGVSGVRVISELQKLGIDPSSLDAILVTHEHDDHIKGVGILSRKFDLPIYASYGTWSAMEKKVGSISQKNICVIEPETDFYLGDLDIMPFSIPHDAAQPCGYVFENNGIKFSLATDIGCIRSSWLDHIIGSDAVLLESNYDPGMLEVGKYPMQLKNRIASRRGHLCNDDAAEVSKKLVESGTTQIMLGHLSKENNFPELAFMCTDQYLQSNGILSGEDMILNVAKRDECSGYFEINKTEC